MPRKQAVKSARETSESEGPADIFASAQQKMATLQRSRNTRRRTVANKHAEELDRVKKRIEARLDAERKRAQAQKEVLEKYIAAVSSVLDTEKKIEAKAREMHRQCGRFVGLLALVHEGRAEEALRVDLEKLELRGSSDSTA